MHGRDILGDSSAGVCHLCRLVLCRGWRRRCNSRGSPPAFGVCRRAAQQPLLPLVVDDCNKRRRMGNRRQARQTMQEDAPITGNGSPNRPETSAPPRWRQFGSQCGHLGIDKLKVVVSCDRNQSETKSERELSKAKSLLRHARRRQGGGSGGGAGDDVIGRHDGIHPHVVRLHRHPLHQLAPERQCHQQRRRPTPRRRAVLHQQELGGNAQTRCKLAKRHITNSNARPKRKAERPPVPSR